MNIDRRRRRVAAAAIAATACVAATTAGIASPAGAEASATSPPASDVTVLRDNLRRITVTVPSNWTNTRLGFTVADDGRLRPGIEASPDHSASRDGWVSPWVSFDVRPPTVEPASLLDAVRYRRSCVDGGVEPFDNGRFVGFRQTWTECGGGTYQIIHVAARAADETYTAFVRIGVPRPDDPAVDLILDSFGTVPGAVALSPSAAPNSLEVIGPVDATVLSASDAESATVVTDDTGTLTIAVPSEWTHVATSPDTNDDQSQRPTIRASWDLDAYSDWVAPGVRVRVVTGIDPSVLLANHDWPGRGCTDSGVYGYHPDGASFAGFVQVWTDCPDSDARLVIAAVTTPDGSASVLVEAKLFGDTTPLATVLGSLQIASSEAVPDSSPKVRGRQLPRPAGATADPRNGQGMRNKSSRDDPESAGASSGSPPNAA